MSLCEYALKLLVLAGCTYFWLWYLTYELTHLKRKDDSGLRWWEKEL